MLVNQFGQWIGVQMYYPKVNRFYLSTIKLTAYKY
jgi:hypothetical protein